MTNVLAELSEILGVPAGDIIVEVRRLTALDAKPRATLYGWAAVPAGYKYAATDADGEVYAYESKPTLVDGWSYWAATGGSIYQISERSPAADWRESLEARPQ